MEPVHDFSCLVGTKLLGEHAPATNFQLLWRDAPATITTAATLLTRGVFLVSDATRHRAQRSLIEHEGTNLSVEVE